MARRFAKATLPKPAVETIGNVARLSGNTFDLGPDDGVNVVVTEFWAARRPWRGRFSRADEERRKLRVMGVAAVTLDLAE